MRELDPQLNTFILFLFAQTILATIKVSATISTGIISAIFSPVPRTYLTIPSPLNKRKALEAVTVSVQPGNGYLYAPPIILGRTIVIVKLGGLVFSKILSQKFSCKHKYWQISLKKKRWYYKFYFFIYYFIFWYYLFLIILNQYHESIKLICEK